MLYYTFYILYMMYLMSWLCWCFLNHGLALTLKTWILTRLHKQKHPRYIRSNNWTSLLFEAFEAGNHELWRIHLIQCTPPKTNGWNLKMFCWKGKMHLQTTNFWKLHLSFLGGCNGRPLFDLFCFNSLKLKGLCGSFVAGTSLDGLEGPLGKDKGFSKVMIRHVGLPARASFGWISRLEKLGGC